MNKIIDSIDLPSGLRSLSLSQLQQVVDELRQELISSVASSGGHFASSLGVAELSVVLHHLFNTPDEKLIWDVGHQGYIHKMLTGRRDRMHSIRKTGGLSGFLRRDESVYDVFGAGHAGTSISAAVGVAEALKRRGSKDKVVAVIGDGSLTAGMAFEALNNAGELGLDNLIVVLNDNEMSISPNVGAVSRWFSLVVTGKTSTLARSSFKKLFQAGYIPDIVYKAVDRAEEATQGFLGTPGMLFEAFGFRYIGPIDGHNVEDLVKALGRAKTQDVPVLVHVRTVKGKGYTPAEEDPLKWHGVNPFDPNKGEFLANKSVAVKAPATYSAIFGKTVTDLARRDNRIIGITAAMPSGTGLDYLQKELPEQFYDVGICEQHAVTFSAGLATEGYHPVCAIYSTFLQRAFDQVVHDVCIQNLPVLFALDRGGLVGNDGETHQGVFDIAYLRMLPNMVLMSPKDEAELQRMVVSGIAYDGPAAIRFPRGNGIGVQLSENPEPLEIGKAEVLRRGADTLLIAYGPLVGNVLKAADILESEYGISSTVINARFAKPLDELLLKEELGRYQLIMTVEDHAKMGGFGSAISELIQRERILTRGKVINLGVDDQFVTHAAPQDQYAWFKLDIAGIVQTVVNNWPEKVQLKVSCHAKDDTPAAKSTLIARGASASTDINSSAKLI